MMHLQMHVLNVTNPAELAFKEKTQTALLAPLVTTYLISLKERRLGLAYPRPPQMDPLPSSLSQIVKNLMKMGS